MPRRSTNTRHACCPSPTEIIEPPTFDQRLEAQVVLPGQRAVLEVKVSGKPPPRVTWTRDGRPIKDGDNGVVISQRDNHHTLTIENG